jgi:predicted ATPase/DNA-binding SARP family transcriptional activator
VEIRLLGPLQVLEAKRVVALPRRQQRALLAALALRAGEVVSTDRLIGDLWGERAPASAPGSLQNTVSALRKTLGRDVLVTQPPGYRLAVEPESVDVNRFERLLENARGADPARRAALLGEALALWHGPALADLDVEEFARTEGARLDELRIAALEERIDAEFELGRHRSLVGELESLVAAHPLHERLRGQLMLALYRCGRQAEALEVYQAGRLALTDELGIDPSPDLQELQRRILRQDSALEATPEPSSGTGALSPRTEPSRLPAGTVTFLFTDIEGSTRHLQTVGAKRYAEALAAYRRAVRDACARNGGVEVDVEGDGVFVAFSTASAAVAAARELGDAFASGEIRVRVGVHTGTPLLTAEGYVGVDVHRAARIAAAAYGGQVLTSQSTAALVDEVLQPLGAYRLPDLLEPLLLYQLGEGNFPAPRSLGKSSLPVQPTPFVGREQELAQVLALLRDQQIRLVTLTGAGGSGKTRLALQAAAESAAEYPDGVLWVPLQTLRDPQLVEPTIAQGLGARDDLSDHFGSGRALLLLDNFEQVIGAATNLGRLCARLPNLKLLVTSREPLHLAAEREYPVQPLREREAVAFFGERARAVDPDFTNDHVVPEICRRLDCLPLALELAAARIKALSTQNLLRRLDKRLPLLTGGPRDAPERQRTLRAAIGWSYELLTPHAQRVFAGLAVFAGGCTLDAAEEICGADVDAIAELVDKSLLRREGERYFMLETIGEYALERLAAGGELAKLRQRHAEFYVELARSIEDMIRSPEAAALLDQLGRDHDNLRAAIAWLAEAPPDRALRLALWGLAGRLHGFADLALDRRNTAEAARLYRESLEISRKLEDDLQSAYSLAGIAAVGATRGRRDLAARLWGCIRAFEEMSSTRLHETERTRYERVLDELEQAPDTSSDFTQGKSMTLDEAVEYALANAD